MDKAGPFEITDSKEIRWAGPEDESVSVVDFYSSLLRWAEKLENLDEPVPVVCVIPGVFKLSDEYQVDLDKLDPHLYDGKVIHKNQIIYCRARPVFPPDSKVSNKIFIA